jgi:hypothetical protein
LGSFLPSLLDHDLEMVSFCIQQMSLPLELEVALVICFGYGLGQYQCAELLRTQIGSSFPLAILYFCHHYGKNLALACPVVAEH